MQGLRAVAVVAVVADHLLHKPSGGFAGVDVFFVISGFLITGQLLRETDQSGRIDLLNFYRRRVKRTLPLAVAVIAFCAAAGMLLFPAHRIAQLWEAALAASTFWINWQLIAHGADYLHSTDVPTPLQHFWSLAVEEQFYLVWPLVIIVLATMARRCGLGRRTTVGALAVVVSGISLGFCFWQTSTAPTAAYFSTFGRAWELGVGAGLAACSPLLSRLRGTWRPTAAWLGTAAILVAFVRIDSDSPFPAPWALLPVGGTALVIAASQGAHDLQIYPLTNKLSQYVGDISYSVYLWHFPVIIFVGALVPETRLSHLLEALIIVAISIISFHLLEAPLRTTSWRQVLARRPRFEGRRPSVLVLASGAALVVGLAAVPVVAEHSASAAAEQPAPAAAAAAAAAAAPPPSSEIATAFVSRGLSAAELRARSDVASASREQQWPMSVREDVAAGREHLPTIWTSGGCLWTQHDSVTPIAKADACVSGARTAAKTAVLFGDSIALSYYPALRAALDPRVWRIRILTAEQCPAWRMSVVRDDKSDYPQCDTYRRLALADIAAKKPDLVVTAGSYSALWRARLGESANAQESWSSGAVFTINALSRTADEVLVLDAPQMSPPLQDCLTATATPATCAGHVDQSYADAYIGENDAIADLGVDNVIHPATVAWYCTANGTCPPVVDGNQTLADGMHPSESDAPRIEKLIAAALAGNGRSD